MHKAPTNISRIAAAVASCPDPLGADHAFVMGATGIDSDSVSYAFQYLMRAGRVFRLGKAKDSRYFASAEIMEAARTAFDERAAMLVVHRAERKRLSKLKPPKPKKVKAVKAPKPVKAAGVDAPVSVKAQQKSPKWSDMPAIVPPGVKVQRVSGCPARTRFEPPSFFRGEFSREWKELRGL